MSQSYSLYCVEDYFVNATECDLCDEYGSGRQFFNGLVLDSRSSGKDILVRSPYDILLRGNTVILRDWTMKKVTINMSNIKNFSTPFSLLGYLKECSGGTGQGGGGLSDGDYGDMTISGDGKIITLKNDIVGADELENTTVVAGTYNVSNITVDAQGRITSASAATADLIPLATPLSGNNNVESALVYLDNKPAADGSETKVNAGTNVTITGSGTIADPYVVNVSSGTAIVGDGDYGDVVVSSGGSVWTVTGGGGSVWTNLDGTGATTSSTDIKYNGGQVGVGFEDSETLPSSKSLAVEGDMSIQRENGAGFTSLTGYADDGTTVNWQINDKNLAMNLGVSAGSQDLVITSSGKVIINGTTPIGRLSSQHGSQWQLALQDDANKSTLVRHEDNGLTRIAFTDDGGSTTKDLFWRGNGNDISTTNSLTGVVGHINSIVKLTDNIDDDTKVAYTIPVVSYKHTASIFFICDSSSENDGGDGCAVETANAVLINGSSNFILPELGKVYELRYSEDLGEWFIMNL